MAKQKKSSAVIGLQLLVEKRNGYFHVGANPAIIGHTPYELAQIDLGRDGNNDSVRFDSVRNVSCRYDSDLINGLDLDGLRVWSQGDSNSAEREYEQLYGWSYEYHDMFTVDKRKANAMSKTLDIIERRMDKLRDTVGRPKTFGQFVAHVAKAIGATKLVIVPKSAGTNWSWSEVEKRFEDFPTGAIDHIDYVVRQLVEEHKPKGVA